MAPGAPPCIGALWHESLLVGAYVFRDRGIGVTVSRSRDGDLIAAVLTRLGYVPRRGSSSRGGSAALKALVRTVRQGVTVAIQTDGPRGPARRSKVGVVALARLTGAPIAPIVFSAAPALRFRSWDRTLLPPPFARIEGRYGAGLRVQPSVDDDADERVRAALDARLDQLSDALDRDMALRRSGRAA